MPFGFPHDRDGAHRYLQPTGGGGGEGRVPGYRGLPPVQFLKFQAFASHFAGFVSLADTPLTG